MGDHPVDKVYHLGDLILLEPAGGDGWGTHTYARGLEGRAAVKGHHVLIDGDVSLHQGVFHQLAGDFGELVAQVYEHAVVISTPRDNGVSQLGKALGHGGSVGLHLLLVGFEFGF